MLSDKPVDDAARRATGKYVGDFGVGRLLGLERGTVDGAGFCFGAEKVCSADLGGDGTQFCGCFDAFGGGNTACRNDRQFDPGYDLGEQRKGTHVQTKVARQKVAAMATGLEPLCNDRVCASLLQPQGFGHRGGTGQYLHAVGFDVCQQVGGR